MKFTHLKLALPVSFVWIVIGLTILPDLVYFLGFDFGSIDFIWKIFIHNTLEIVSIATAFIIVFLSIIDFKIKGDVSTPLVAITMLCSGMLDMVHVLATNNLIFQEHQLTFITIYTWAFSRTFNALMLLIGAGMFLIQSDNLFKNVRAHNRRFLWYVIGLLSLITIAYVTLVAQLSPEWVKRITPFVLQRKIDIIPLILYLFSLTIIFPKFYSNRPSVFSQTLLLSLIPSIAAQLHVMSGSALPYDNNAMIAYYDKLISYLIPFAGIALNYLQTHKNEVSALNNYKVEAHHKNVLNSLLEGIMDVSPNGIMVFEKKRNKQSQTVDFQTVLFNQAAGSLTGKRLERGMLLSRIYEKQPELIQRYLDDEGYPIDLEYYDEEQDKWLRILGVQFKDGFVNTVIDITQSKLSEESLRRREELLSQAEELAKLGSWEWDIESGKTIWSDHLYKLFGYEKDTFDNKVENASRNLFTEDAERVKKEMEDAIRKKKPYEMEYRRLMKDGTVRTFFSKGRPIMDHQGKVVKVTGVTMDITEQKKTIARVRYNEVLYKTFASSMPDTEVVLFDLDFRIILAAGNIRKSLLNDKESLTGSDIRSFLRNQQVSLQAENALTDKPSGSLETIQEINQSNFHFQLGPVRSNEGDILSGMLLIQDVTEIKMVESSLQQKILDLDRSNQELENFAYVASHDLQEPLRKITSFGDRIKSKYSSSLPLEGTDYLNRMIDATHRMQRLISDLLSFSRITRASEEFQRVDLNKVIRDILNDIEIIIQKTGARCEVGKLPLIDAVPTQMHQLFQNLLLNSIKFHKKDVPPDISIESETVQLYNDQLKKKTDYVLIRVRDNGIGFDQIYAEKIFALFQRLHGRVDYEGTGIGLALCKRIAENHSGKISAMSEEGAGAIFTVVLPIHQVSNKAPNLELSI